MSTSVIVFGGAGGQGSAVVSQLLQNGQQIRVALRPSSKREFPESVEVVDANFSQPGSLRRAAEGTRVAVVILPLVFDPSLMRSYGEACVAAAEAAGVEHVVYNASICVPDEPIGYPFFDDGIRPVIERTMAADVPATILRPPLYLDNLLAPWTHQGIEADNVIRYPMPARQPVPWSSHSHQAALVSEAVGRGPEVAGTVYDVAMPIRASGEEVAGAVSQVLGRSVSYDQITPDEFAEKVAEFWGPEAAEHVRTLYQLLTKDGFALLDRDYDIANQTFQDSQLTPSEWAEDALRKRPTDGG